ncbi:MAG: carbohydrate ABC transporter permease, partial [Treponema sp.]|nr:carbohydrate ABC transporter permease [Treponema sp.]
MKRKKNLFSPIADIVSMIIVLLIFGIPFYYMLINSLKNRREAGIMNLKLPEKILFLENYAQVIEVNNYMIIRAFINSVLITLGGIILLVIVCSL